ATLLIFTLLPNNHIFFPAPLFSLPCITKHTFPYNPLYYNTGTEEMQDFCEERPLSCKKWLHQP
ncbi:MAG: hypothetical protein IJ344_06345, partial [Clostridia bacterium]|nr:hypothetical protein [Clostridia bacterium]